MQFWKKINTYRLMILSRQVLLLVFCLLCVARPVCADGITISQASTRLVDDVYYLDAVLDFEFEDEVLKALQHGVAFNINIEIILKRERDWLWDPKIKEEILKIRLEQHPLSNRYIFTEINTGNRQQFGSLSDALARLGKVTNYFLVSEAVLSAGETYVCMIRAELSTESLPAVIRPAAVISGKWQMDSPWYSWTLER